MIKRILWFILGVILYFLGVYLLFYWKNHLSLFLFLRTQRVSGLSIWFVFNLIMPVSLILSVIFWKKNKAFCLGLMVLPIISIFYIVVSNIYRKVSYEFNIASISREMQGKKIGEDIEITGTISRGLGRPTHNIQAPCFKVDFAKEFNLREADSMLLLSAIKQNKNKGDCRYSVGEPTGYLDPSLEKFEGKKVKMRAKITLCDECQRGCIMCDICCIFYLKPLNIEILEEADSQ